MYQLPPASSLPPATSPGPEASTAAAHYDPEAITAFYRRRPGEVVRRALQICWPVLVFLTSLWWDGRTGRQCQAQRARELKDLITRLGPAYIKIGQALSTRPDLVPGAYLEELSHLQDQLPAFPDELAYQFVREELGAEPLELYAELTPSPIAAASLGQVYKGRLKSGEAVAVKVQRPDLARKIAIDIYLLRTLAAWVQGWFKRIRSDLVGIIDEFAQRMFEEMDYNHEGRNAERFADLYGHMKDVYVPKIYWQYTRRRVLTMEWVDGVKLTNPQKVRDLGINASYLIEVGVQCTLRQLLEYGFFHADPHPGNLLATPDGKLAYLDFGMMSEIDRRQRYGLIEAIVHLVNRDFPGLAQDYVHLEFLSPTTDLTPIIPALAKVFHNALGASVAELNIKSITDQLSDLMYEYPFRVPAFYALIIRSLVTLEGIAIHIDPQFKVLSKAYPYVAKRLLTDPAPELRSSLQDLLFQNGNFRWNRLENLLRNAPHSGEFDFDQVLDQSVEFLLSPRGSSIRESLVREVVKSIDLWSCNLVETSLWLVQERLGLAVHYTPIPVPEQEVTENLRRLWAILKQMPGFEPMHLVSLLAQVLARSEVHQMGRELASALGQRALSRLIRGLVLSNDPDLVTKTAT